MIPINRHDEQYIPPLRYHWLTRFYDPIVRLTTRENTFKRVLLQQIAPRPHDQVLDLGCGTATLTIALAKTFLTVQMLDGFETTDDGVRGRLPTMIGEAGLTEVRQTAAINTPLGTMALYQAAKSRRGTFPYHISSTQPKGARNVIHPGRGDNAAT